MTVMDKNKVSGTFGDAPPLMKAAASPTASILSEAAIGKKILVFTMGSRGDVQPFAALCCGLKNAGFKVHILTNTNHVPFMQEFGLDVTGTHPDAELSLKDDAKMQQLIADGSMLKLARRMAEHNKKNFPSVFEIELKAARAFQPDMLLCAGMESTQGAAIASSMNIPMISCQLRVTVPSKFDPSIMEEPEWLPGWMHLLANRFIFSLIIRSEQEGKHETILKHLPESESVLIKNINQWNHRLESGVEPVICGVSPLVVDERPDWVAPPICSGFWVVPKAEQLRRLASREVAFGGDSRDAMHRFLMAGPMPAYIGWGSLTAIPAERMVSLAVRSLKLAGMRGVILGGWAGLSLEKLAKQPESEELVAYAKKNVLFVQTAAHEWLFPQCSVIVHHGGAGTTAAALRSGRPTVVIPCGLDQFANGRLVERCGAGFMLTRLKNLSPEELAYAIDVCRNDEEMREHCLYIGRQLQREDGIGATVKELDRFFSEEVATGSWAKRSKERQASLAMLAKPSFFKRLGLFCSFMCR